MPSPRVSPFASVTLKFMGPSHTRIPKWDSHKPALFQTSPQRELNKGDRYTVADSIKWEIRVNFFTDPESEIVFKMKSFECNEKGSYFIKIGLEET